MAVDGLNMLGDTGVEDFRELFAEFLGGHIHLQLVLSAMQQLLMAKPEQADRVQQAIDAALQAGQLPEQTWERLTAEFEQLITAEDPTEWSLETAGPQFAGLASNDRLDEEPTQPPGSSDAETGRENGEMGLRPGTLLQDRYVLVSAVNGGAMGTVYKALDRRRKETGDPHPWVAIKLTAADFAGNPAALAALKNEVSLCSRLDHPAIVRVHGLEEDDGLTFIVMEWLDGDTLAELFRRHDGPLPPAQSVRILGDICAALEHAHAAGVMHADLKPANIFITHAGHAKLIDFGIARLLKTEQGQFDAATLNARTRAWASCEVLEGEAVEPRDEVFALGLLAYRLFAGQRPFGKLGALDAEAAGLAPEQPAGLASHRWQVLAAALAFRREQRPESVTAFRDAFFAPAPETARPEITAAESLAEDAEDIVLETVAVPMTSLEALADDAVAAMPEEPPEADAAGDTTAFSRQPASPSAPLASRPWQHRPLRIAAAVTVLGLAGILATSLLRSPGPTEQAPAAATPRTPPEPAAARQSADTARPQDALMLEPIEPTVARRMMPGSPDQPATGSTAASGLAAAPPPVASPAAAPAEVESTATATARAATPATAAQPERRGAVRPPVPAPPSGPATSTGTGQAASPEARPAPTPPAEDRTVAGSAPVASRTAEPAAQPMPPEAPAGAAAGAEQPVRRPMATDRPTETAPPVTSRVLAAEQSPVGPAPADGSQALAAARTAMAMSPPDTGAIPSPEAIGPPAPMRHKPQAPPDEVGPLPPPGPGTVALSALDFRRFVEPDYPRELAARGVEGWVELEFLLDAKGEVESVRIIASEPAGVFDEAALQAVRRWRFKPYRVDGEPVATYSQVRLRFSE